MKIAQVNTVDYNLFKKTYQNDLFKRAEMDNCPGCKKAIPLRDLLKDTVEFSSLS